MTKARDTNLLRQCREQKGVLLVELAAKIERSPAFVSTVEGGFVPKPRSQMAIAQALDTTPDKLWPEEWEKV